MPREKRYYRRSRIAESKFCDLVRCFAEDLSATDVANLIGLTRKSVTNIFLKLRRRIAEDRERSSPLRHPSLSFLGIGSDGSDTYNEASKARTCANAHKDGSIRSMMQCLRATHSEEKSDDFLESH